MLLYGRGHHVSFFLNDIEVSTDVTDLAVDYTQELFYQQCRVLAHLYRFIERLICHECIYLQRLYLNDIAIEHRSTCTIWVSQVLVAYKANLIILKKLFLFLSEILVLLDTKGFLNTLK